LAVTRLDRLARSTRDLLNVLAVIGEREAGFRSLKDTWADTTTPHGRLMLTVLGGLAEFERELIRARTGDGRACAKARGVRFGPSRRSGSPSSALPMAKCKPIWLDHDQPARSRLIEWSNPPPSGNFSGSAQRVHRLDLGIRISARPSQGELCHYAVPDASCSATHRKRKVKRVIGG
jgi:hypothetical protein